MSENHHIGIDFGTSNSSVCWWNPRTNAPEIIRNEYGEEKTPSVVYCGKNGVIVGRPALDQLADVVHMSADEQADIFGRTFLSIKHLLHDNLPLALPDGRVVTPVELTTNILSYLKKSAETGCFNGEQVESATISHPVAFGNKEKSNLQKAAKTAGLKQVTLIEEPVAAIRGYLASGAKAGKNILVFDLGGGTLDLAFLTLEDNGDYHIPIPSVGVGAGGDAYDRILYDHFDRILTRERGQPFSPSGGMVNLSVLNECRKVKEKLSGVETARLSYFCETLNRPFIFDMHRSDFNSLIREQVTRAGHLTEQYIARIKKDGYKINTVLLVGGAARTPAIRTMLAEVLPVKAVATMHADAAVAMGAASDTLLAKGCGHAQKTKGTAYASLVGRWAIIRANIISKPRDQLAAWGKSVKMQFLEHAYILIIAAPLLVAAAYYFYLRNDIYYLYSRISYSNKQSAISSITSKGSEFAKRQSQKSIDKIKDELVDDYENYDKGMPLLKFMATNDNRHANYSLGLIYKHGMKSGRWAGNYYNEHWVTYYTGKDLLKAQQYFRTSALAGERRAPDELAKMYQNGITTNEHSAESKFIVSMNPVERAEIFRIDATSLSIPRAAYHLGECYRQGDGVIQSDDQARHWYQIAAAAGDHLGQYALGKTYKDIERWKDYGHAAKWLKQSAEQDNVEAQYEYAMLLASGLGVARNDVEAVYWLHKGAEKWHAPSQYALGEMYASGRGVPKDERQAKEWRDKALERGYQPSDTP